MLAMWRLFPTHWIKRNSRLPQRTIFVSELKNYNSLEFHLKHELGGPPYSWFYQWIISHKIIWWSFCSWVIFFFLFVFFQNNFPFIIIFFLHFSRQHSTHWYFIRFCGCSYWSLSCILVWSWWWHGLDFWLIEIRDIHYKLSRLGEQVWDGSETIRIL